MLGSGLRQGLLSSAERSRGGGQGWNSHWQVTGARSSFTNDRSARGFDLRLTAAG